MIYSVLITHTHTQNNKTLLIKKSGSNDNNNNRKVRECHNHNPQPTPDTKRKRKRTKINTCKIFFFLFSAYKNVKSFYTGKIAKKKKKMLFVYGMYARLFYCLWHMRNQFSLFRTPTLPYRAQPLLYATGKMSLNWGLDCSSICCMHAPLANCLPSFGRAIG